MLFSAACAGVKSMALTAGETPAYQSALQQSSSAAFPLPFKERGSGWGLLHFICQDNSQAVALWRLLLPSVALFCPEDKKWA